MKDDGKADDQSVDRDQELLEAADFKESTEIVRRRLEAADRGEAGVPAEVVLAEMRKMVGICEENKKRKL